jgi:hypothetical protein
VSRARRFALVSAALALALLTGCSRIAHVSGTAVEDGRAYQPTEEMIALVFMKTDGTLKVSVSLQKDGSFTVYGPDAEGLPAGQYKVGYYSDTDGGRGRKRVKDLPAESSPLELDLKSGDRVSLTIDLIKGTMTRN